MSQNDFNLANQGFPSMRSDMNSAFQALASNSSGATAPGTTYAYQFWYDTSTNLLKMRNADNDNWITLAAFDQAADEWQIRSAVIQAVDGAGVVIKTDEGTTRLTVADDGTVTVENDLVVTGDISAANLPTAGPLSGFRNAIINGNFAINQRNVSGTVTLAAGAYGHDRWKAGASGCTYTFATVENVTTLTITAGSLVQVIEGANLFSGTYTLSFTGTAQGKIGAGSFGASGITGSATGGANLAIEFNTGTVSRVQLEPGSADTPFERRPVGTELALCQRYFEPSQFVLATSALGGGTAVISGRWAVKKRINPTLALFFPSGTGGAIVSLDTSGWYQSAAHSAIVIGTVTGDAEI